jgi:hypothetical protein
MSKKPADAFRVLHTADWHLGKTLNEQSREEEQKRFLDWLLKQVVELEVDVVLVAGGRTRGQAVTSLMLILNRRIKRGFGIRQV